MGPARGGFIHVYMAIPTESELPLSMALVVTTGQRCPGDEPRSLKSARKEALYCLENSEDV